MPNVLVVPVSGAIFFDRNVAGASTVAALNSAVRLSYDQSGGLNITSYATALTALDRFTVDGAQGRLFSITDALTGSLFSVNDISGLPILEVLDTDTVIAGSYNTNTFIVSGTRIAIGRTIDSTAKVAISGNTTVSGILSTNNIIIAFGGNSNQWNSNFSTTQSNSANWSQAYTNLTSNSAAYLSAVDISLLAAASGRWNSNYTTTNANSGQWSQAYTSFNANSSFYDAAVNELFTYVISETGDEFITEDSLLMVDSNIDGYPAWNSTTDTVYNLSAGWENTGNIVANNASNWTSTYTTTNLNSATWNNWSTVSGNYALGSQYVKLSGDTMTGSLTVMGNVSATGTLSGAKVELLPAAANGMLIRATTTAGAEDNCHIVVRPINGVANVGAAINLRASGGSGEIYNGYIQSGNGSITVGGGGVSPMFRVTNGGSGPSTGSVNFSVNNNSTVNVDIANSQAAAAVLRVTGSTAQTGNLTEWRNVTPTTLAFITPTGNIVTTGAISANQGIVCAPSTFTASDTVTDAALIMDFTRGASTGGMYVRRSNGQQRSIFNYQDSAGNIDVGTFSNNINSVSIKAGGSGLTGFINFGTHSTNNAMRIIDSGNLGIGTTAPTQRLTVVGNISATGNLATNTNYVVVAALTANLTMPSAADQLLPLSAKNDPNGWFSNTTRRFTPTVPGYYHADYQVSWQAGTAGSGNQNNIQILKSGTAISLAQQPINSSNVNTTQNTATVVYLNGSTDYLTFQAYSSNAAQVITGEANGTWTKVDIFKIN